jgi:DNA-binding CsgD family transcriptional regulator
MNQQLFYRELRDLMDDWREEQGAGNFRCGECENLYYGLAQLFQRKAGMGLNFTRENPLAVMEMVCLALRILGNDHQEIADALRLKPSTIRTHEERVRKKLKVHSLAQATYIALKKNYLRINEEQKPFCHLCCRN